MRGRKRGIFALVDDDTLQELEKHKWYILNGYAFNRLNYMHRLVLNAVPGQVVDHINGNKLDNRRENLRFVTVSLNAARAKWGHAVSGAHGVVVKKNGKYQARIIKHSRNYSLGAFDTMAEAQAARRGAEVVLYPDLLREKLA